MEISNRRVYIKSINIHFSTIAQKYRELRTTDLEPVFYIKKELENFSKIVAADVGCGVGRYVLKLFCNLGNKLYLYCIDCNQRMLEELKQYLILHNIENFQVKNTLARRLPLPNESLDCVFTFNAIHHFRIFEFLFEVSRVLKNGGYLFIYTRLRSQNRRSIWGRYFPLFTKKEIRLYELDELKRIITETPSLEIQNIEFFKYQRTATLDWLIQQARNHHYSTFHLYTEDEFEKSLYEFTQKIKGHFKDMNHISWIDRNVMLVERKRIN